MDGIDVCVGGCGYVLYRREECVGCVYMCRMYMQNVDVVGIVDYINQMIV